MCIKKCAVALGIFDGVHLGHRAVLDLALRQKENGLTPAVFSFSPSAVLRKTSGQDGYVYNWSQKFYTLQNLGFSGENIHLVDFEDVCGFTGEEFCEKILKNRFLNAEAVCCGNDFRFGRGASCGVEELKRFGEIYGFEVHTADDVKIDGVTVSSGEIRQLLLNGEIEKAERLLGMPYMISGKVVHGRQIGRTIDFPTVNQLFADGQLVPAFGVYASTAVIDGKSYDSVTNIGVKPTVGAESSPLAETHIIGFSGDIYGRSIDIVLKKFLRPEVKFNSLDELKKQISKDVSDSITKY